VTAGVGRGPAGDSGAGGGALPLVLVGGIAGLAWASGLRGYMVEIAGPATTVGWVGTFVGILLPGAVAGGVLGWAEHARRTGGRPRLRWAAPAPLAFLAANPYAPVSVVTDGGIGGAAIAVPLIGMAGGWALSGRGRLAARVAAGALIPVAIVGGAAAAAVVGGLGVGSPRWTWVALLWGSSMAVLVLACAIPHLPVTQRPVTAGAQSPVGGSLR
jgi:hypothetical protein